MYLDLLKRCLTRVLIPDRTWEFDLSGTRDFNLAERTEGKDWPTEGETMIGLRRLDNLQRCVETVIQDAVPGDLVETGVWRGGASILMRAVLAAYGDQDRKVWVADSFCGLPAPNPGEYPVDSGDPHHGLNKYLAVSLDEVKENFRRYSMLDDRVRFLPGWFKDTLSNAPLHIAVARLDGDMYESTMQALGALYPKVSSGGFVIIDDYGALERCRSAVEDYRSQHYIDEPIQWVDWTGIYWRKK